MDTFMWFGLQCFTLRKIPLGKTPVFVAVSWQRGIVIVCRLVFASTAESRPGMQVGHCFTEAHVGLIDTLGAWLVQVRYSLSAVCSVSSLSPT